MKSFRIGQLLIYDPTLKSKKHKPIEIQQQEAKIIAYFPPKAELEQKCNTVGMAEGVYSFCHSLLGGEQQREEDKKELGWQTIFMESCTLILSEVQQNAWIFVKLQHSPEGQYHRLGESEDNYYIEQSFSDNSCRLFMNTLYQNFKMFYGYIRSWVFKQQFEQLQHLLNLFVPRFHEIYKYQNQPQLNMISFITKDIRLIPLDVNTTLKFTYFKNVLQSYNSNIAHVIVFAHGVLTYTSLGKNTTQLISKYLFSNGEPYFFSELHKNRVSMMRELPKSNQKERYGLVYNSKVIGFQQVSQSYRLTMVPPKTQSVDLLGIESEQNPFQFFDIYIEEELGPMKVNFYAQNNMFFVTIFRSKPEISEIFFQNRFYHDNADKFISKINESIPSILKPSDPYKFIFHNCATYTGKSTIKEWKNIGIQVRNALELMQKNPEGVMATSTQYGYWVYGVHRLSRILILLIPMEVGLGKLEDFVGKMTREYFSKAFL